LALLGFSLAAESRAQTCYDSVSLVSNGFKALKSAKVGMLKAEQICIQILKERPANSAASERCRQLQSKRDNERLRDAPVREALDSFEKSYNMPHQSFVQALKEGSLPELLANVPSVAARPELLKSLAQSSSPSNSDAGPRLPETAPPKLEAAAARVAPYRQLLEKANGGRGPRSTLRDQLRRSLASDNGNTARPHTLEREFNGLTPLAGGDFPRQESPETAEVSQTLFDVVHEKYQSLEPRLRPKKDSALR